MKYSTKDITFELLDIYSTLGMIDYGIGRMYESKKYSLKGLKLAELKYKEAHPIIADNLSRLGMIYHLDENNSTEGEKYLRQSF